MLVTARWRSSLSAHSRADIAMDVPADDGDDGQWLTHADLAAVRGISTASAIKPSVTIGESRRTTAALSAALSLPSGQSRNERWEWMIERT